MRYWVNQKRERKKRREKVVGFILSGGLHGAVRGGYSSRVSLFAVCSFFWLSVLPSWFKVRRGEKICFERRRYLLVSSESIWSVGSDLVRRGGNLELWSPSIQIWVCYLGFGRFGTVVVFGRWFWSFDSLFVLFISCSCFVGGLKCWLVLVFLVCSVVCLSLVSLSWACVRWQYGAWTSGAVSFSYCGSSSVLSAVQVGADFIFNRSRVTDEVCVFVWLWWTSI